ncbi:MAG: electron transport complex subunit RsxD [Thiothrix sp.]|nr:MAG: electron transport complex subunit RsxD [Thiothrix sp.]
MIFGIKTSPYMHAPQSVGQVMAQVIYALLPGTLALLWFFGWGVVTNLLLSLGFAVLLEALMLKLRERPLLPFLTDYSAVVTGWLLAVALPPYSPWWLILIALMFAMVIGKHLYGGLGYNPFNPAMVGYAAVLVSFPIEMTSWPAPALTSIGALSLNETIQQVFLGGLSTWDGLTQATSLDTIKTHLRLGETVEQISQGAAFGWIGGQAWEWVSVAWLAGGLWLIYRKIISWHIPVALMAALAGMALVFWLINPDHYSSPLFHLMTGASILGAFFIATDPVSASTTPLGKLLYAGGIGCFTYIIRVWGSYPDAIAFAVLIMNMAVPLLDTYTQPRVYGTKGRFGS